MSSLLLEALDTCGIQYKYYSANEAYKQGLLLNEIRTILANAKKVGEIVKQEVGQETYTEFCRTLRFAANAVTSTPPAPTNLIPKPTKLPTNVKV
jgi:lysyl-tRNA synthetase class I